MKTKGTIQRVIQSVVMIVVFFTSVSAARIVNAQRSSNHNKFNSPAQNHAATIGSCQVFPQNNYWNTPVDDLQLHSLSAAWINTIGGDQGFHMDFGSGTWDGGPIGIPFNILSSSLTPNYVVDFYYPDDSDAGPYPIPLTPNIEWGSDHHILSVDTDDCKLYEIYDASKQSGQWFGGSGAIWDLNSNALRPDGWTSADAAGLPILAGLVRYDEIVAGEIVHALRFTANCTADYYIWPARHVAQSGSCITPVPFGARFRLKENYDITGYSSQAQIILQAMKTYGIVLADNGSPWYVSGAPDANWDNDILHELDDLTGNDFDAVDTSGLMIDMNSGATPYLDYPVVHGIMRANPDPTAAASVNFTVTFSESVTGVDTSAPFDDFTLTKTGGIIGEAVSGVSGSDSVYIITVNTGSGLGTIRLDVVDDDTILDAASNLLGGTGSGNGNFNTGQSYTVVSFVYKLFLPLILR